MRPEIKANVAGCELRWKTTITSTATALFLAKNPPQVESPNSSESKTPTSEEQSKAPGPDYHDLESAIMYFNGKAQKIDELPINEDEKEMLLIKLQEKRERVLDDFIWG